MTSRILLVRHGRPAHVQQGWIDRDGLAGWQAAYDASGLHADDVPPAALWEAAARAGLVVASDLPRAIESARQLAGDGAGGAVAVELTPLLREIPLWLPTWPVVRLPLAGWALAVGAHALLRRARQVPTPEAVTTQAARAAAWLAERALRHGSVVAVTHAAFRGHLDRALRAEGWCGARTRRWAHWSAWALTRDAAPPPEPPGPDDRQSRESSRSAA